MKKIGKNIYDQYLNELIDNIYKILCVYEDCINKYNSLYPFVSHTEKLIDQLKGSESFLQDTKFLTIASNLTGMLERKDLSKKYVKSMTFHCIDIITKIQDKEDSL